MNDRLYDIAREVTDEVLGKGTYAEVNKGNPNPGVQATIARSQRKDVTKMTAEERRAWLAETKPAHDLSEIIRKHIFHSSRPWPDGSQPTAPNWNPGCSCGEAMYFFEWDLHLANAIIAEGWKREES